MKKLFYALSYKGALVLLGAVLLLSCKGKDGDPGPQGTTGDTGAQGAQGAQGDRAAGIIKKGFVSGHITGYRKDGVTPLDENFKYEFIYVKNTNNDIATETITPGTYQLYFYRYDSLQQSFFTMTIESPLTFASPVVTQAYLTYSKDIGNNQVLGVDGSYHKNAQSPVTITGQSYDTTTGIFSGNYTWDADPAKGTYAASGRPFVVTGSFSIPFNIISGFRKAANAGE